MNDNRLLDYKKSNQHANSFDDVYSYQIITSTIIDVNYITVFSSRTCATQHLLSIILN